MIQKILEKQSEEKTKLKALEEMAELSEVLLKTLTKNGKEKPPLEKIIEELGDVEFRLLILKTKLGITTQVAERFQNKQKEVIEFYEK